MRQIAIAYTREENDGCFSIAISENNYPNYKLVNETTKYILSLMDGVNTVGDISKKLISTYGSIYEPQIRNDVSNIMKELWMDGIIDWKDGFIPEMDNASRNILNGYTVEVAFENDMKRLFNFLQDNSNVDDEKHIKFTSHMSGNSTISEYAIRWQLFNMNSIYLMLLKDGKIQGVIAVGVPSLSSVATLDLVLCKKEHLAEFLKTATSMLNPVSVTNITKLRIYFSENQVKTFLGDIVDSFGFKKIAFLEQENGLENFYMYDYLICKEI